MQQRRRGAVVRARRATTRHHGSPNVPTNEPAHLSRGQIAAHCLAMSVVSMLSSSAGDLYERAAEAGVGRVSVGAGAPRACSMVCCAVSRGLLR